MKSDIRLIDYVQSLRANGRFLFLKNEAAQALKVSDNAIISSIKRLADKRKVAYLKKGLYQIITEEYSHSGSLPPEWFMDDLMEHLRVPYYIGLLTAASFYGASHQAPQVFQVVCQQKIPALIAGSLKINFYYSKHVCQTPTQQIKTPAGYVRVSTPEGTAFDLIRYFHQSGHINHVATVLSELADVINVNTLADVAENMPIFLTQRLGYILDHIERDHLIEPLHRLVSKRAKRYIPLRPDNPIEGAQKNDKWHVIVNEEIETDL